MLGTQEYTNKNYFPEGSPIFRPDLYLSVCFPSVEKLSTLPSSHIATSWSEYSMLGVQCHFQQPPSTQPSLDWGGPLELKKFCAETLKGLLLDDHEVTKRQRSGEELSTAPVRRQDHLELISKVVSSEQRKQWLLLVKPIHMDRHHHTQCTLGLRSFPCSNKIWVVSTFWSILSSEPSPHV